MLLPGGQGDIEAIGALQNLATFLLRQGKFAEAEPIFVEVHDLYRASVPNHFWVAYPLLSLADLHLQTAAYSEAEQRARAALVHLRKTLPDGHLVTAVAESRLGGALIGLHRYDDAELHLLAAYDAMKKVESRDTYVGETRARLVELYTALERPDRAESYRTDSIE